MKRNILALAAIVACVCIGTEARATSILGTAEDFAVLGSSTVTNTGSTVISGSATVLSNVGVYSPGGANATTGFSSTGNTFVGPGTNSNGPGIVNAPAEIHLGDAVAQTAQADNVTAYNGLAGMPYNQDLSGTDLGGLTLTPGVYHFSSSAALTGTLTLNAEGDNNAYWVFQIGSTLTTASSSVVQFINLATNDGGADDGVFWQVGSSATLNSTAFEGNILALATINMYTGSTDPNGRLLAQTAAVNLQDNTISDVCPNGGPGLSGGLEFAETAAGIGVVPIGLTSGGGTATIPEPCTLLLFGTGFAGLLARALRQRKA